MHIIQIHINKFLKDIAQSKSYKIPSYLLNKFGNETKEALRRQFEKEERRPFHLTMGNVGRPICQLQHETIGTKGDSSYNLIRNTYGNLAESLLMFLLYASGINVVAEQKRTSLEIAGKKLNGVLDVILDLGDGPSVWELKSSSGWAFTNKFDVSFEDFHKQDFFGYVNQLFLYAEAEGVKAGGFLVFDKSSGEIKILAVPDEQEKYRKRVLKDVTHKVKTVGTSKNIDKQFSPIPEVFKKKLTGNKLLDITCSFCPFRFDCWPTLQIKPQALSTAKKPKMIYYIEYNTP